MNKKNITKRNPIKKRFWLTFLRGFTLIEIIIILAIVSVLMLSLKNIFQVKNKDQYYAQVCTNNIYGQISNFIYQWITGKSIRTGLDNIFPDSYKIIFDPSQNWVFLYYIMSDWTTWVKNEFILSWSMPSSYYCKSNSYTISLSGKITIVELVRWLQEKSHNLDVFQIKDQSGNTYITWSILFQICDKNNTVCKKLSEYLIDKRNQNIIHRLCLTWADGWECEERDK